MKYFVPFALILTLVACDKGLSESESNKNVTVKESYLDAPLTGKVAKSGLYRLVRSGGVVNNAKTSTGKAISRPVVQFIKSAERIPLIKGAQMYMQYRLWPLPSQPAYADIRRVLKHPEMTLPDGTVTTGSDFMLKRKVSSNQVISYTGYGLDEDYELVEGEWRIEIWYGDKKLIDQKFITYKPAKGEIAELMPLLELGNNVLTEMKMPEKETLKNNWPRITVKPDGDEKIPALSELKKAMDDPFVGTP
jgi:hypothetical protein